MDKQKLDVIKRFKATGVKRVALGISCGKDSVAALVILKRFGFEVCGYHYYTVEGIGFVERYLNYLSKKFDTPILQLRHPDGFDSMIDGEYRPMTNNPLISRVGFSDLETVVKKHYGVYWTTGGEKMIDSLDRRGMVNKCEGIDPKRGRFYPLAQWNNRDVMATLQHARIIMPPDYTMNYESWGGQLKGAWLYEIRKRFPDDYIKILAQYPYAEAAIVKYEMELKNG
jgi:3'-phosphoadenosine 5'-phosphosulfate sulfotransferase (PAPS reductase)/FAD synthetase